MYQKLFQIHTSLSLLTIIVYIQHSETARILVIAQTPSKSHYNMHKTIVNGLLTRGHEITFFNPFDESKTHENLTNYNILDESKVSYVDSIPVDDKKFKGIFNNLLLPIHDNEKKMCKNTLSHPKMKEIIKMEKIPYDLIMFETFVMFCFLPLAEKHHLPAIHTIPISWIVSDYYIGRPNLLSYIPIAFADHSYDMNFFQRLCNTIGFAVYMTNQFLFSNPACNQIIREHYGPNFKSVDEMHNNIKLTLYASHPTMISTPIPPNVVEIGGIHIADEKPLPEDIRRFIDESNEGVVYASFGTTIRFSSIPPEKMDVILAAFSEIPHRILLRCDTPNNTKFSSNVMAKTWMPQRDILAHKKVRAFISHLGLNSMLEAMYTGKPVVAVPFIFDQLMDARLAEKIGIGVYLDFDSLTKDDLVNAVKDVIHDERYFNKMQEVSSAFRDRPMSPLDTAIYWIEYVIRHNGASHLTPISAQLPLYKYLLLDVLLFIIVAFGILSYILYFLTFKIITKIFKSSSKNSGSTKKKQ